MLVVMKAQATEEQIKAVCDHIEFLGYRPHPMPGAQRTAIGITGNQGEANRGNLEEMPGVAEVIKVSKPYKLASRDVKEENTVIRFAGTDAAIGGENLAIVAGPCSIESREQAFAIFHLHGQLHGVVRRRVAFVPLHVDAPLGVVQKIDDVGTGGGMDRNALAAGDVTDDLLATNRIAALRPENQHVVGATHLDLLVARDRPPGARGGR